MTTKEFTTFEQFYPHYLAEHSNITNRRLHVLGSSLSLLILLLCVFLPRIWSNYLVIPLIGYGFAWVGHFFF